MKKIDFQIGVTLDSEAIETLVGVLTQAIEKGTIQCTQAVVKSNMTRRVDEPVQQRRRMTPVEASQHANFSGQKPPEDMGLLVDSREAAKLLKVSPRTLWGLYNSGQMPAPIRIGRAVRWSYEQLREWVNEGCPPDQRHAKARKRRR